MTWSGVIGGRHSTWLSGEDCVLTITPWHQQGDGVVINWALNKLIQGAEGNREELLGLVAERGQEFDTVNVATCLNR
jgi:hypothetical protein